MALYLLMFFEVTCLLGRRKMLRFVYVEDEKYFQKEVKTIIIQHYIEKQMAVDIQIYNSAEMLNYDLQENKYYDVYMLDIGLEKKDDGLNLAKKIRKLQAHAIIIFITSHLEFALKGYDYAAFQFIDKQKIKEKIPEVLTCVDEKLALQNKNYYIISTNSRYIKIPLEDKIYIYKEAKNCIFVCKNNETAYVRATIQKIYSDLNDEMFIFANRSYIVNVIHIRKVDCKEVYLDNDDTIIISRNYSLKVKEEIHNYWRKHIH